MPGPKVNGPLTPLTFRIYQLSIRGRGFSSNPTADERATFLADARTLRIDAIVIGPSRGRRAVEEFCQRLLRTPGQSSGGVTVFRVR